MTESTTAIRITNHNNFPIVDRHNGIEYTFRPGIAMTIPEEVAKHIIGWGDPNWDLYLRKRWGWNRTSNMAEAVDWLKNITIEPIAMRTVEVPPDMSDEDLQEAIALAGAQPPEELPIA